MSSKTKIVLALDGLPFDEAVDLTSRVGDRCYAVKIHTLFDKVGATVIHSLKSLGVRVWADVKLHDIPKTAADRTVEIFQHGARIISAHASGGVEMMRAVVTQVDRYGPEASAWASLLLTSLDEKEIARSHGGDRTRGQIMLDLALTAQEAGMDGVICSPREIGMLKKHPNLEGMKFIAVGIRPEGVSVDDQKRFGTPQEAVENGADFMVVGRAVTKARNPIAMFNAIAFEIGTGAQTERKDLSQSIVLH